MRVQIHGEISFVGNVKSQVRNQFRDESHVNQHFLPTIHVPTAQHDRKSVLHVTMQIHMKIKNERGVIRSSINYTKSASNLIRLDTWLKRIRLHRVRPGMSHHHDKVAAWGNHCWNPVL